MTWLAPTATGVRLTLHVQPRATRTEVVGLHGEALKIRVAAPPVEGAANAEVVRWLAVQLGIPRTRVVLLHGGSSRRKVVQIDGMTVAAVQVALIRTA